MRRSARKVTDQGDGGAVAGPERTCAVTRTPLAPDELIRFVRAPDGRIVPDLARRLPGRGVWVAGVRKTLETGMRGGAFARALRQPVIVPEDLADLVDRLLVRRTVEALSLANKAGLVVTGFTRTEAAIVAGECAALIHASDAADDGAAKLDRKLRAIWKARDEASDPVIVTALASAELSLAMGRANVVHAALTPGGAGTHFVREAGRLQRYRTASTTPAGSPEAGAKTEQV